MAQGRPPQPQPPQQPMPSPQKASPMAGLGSVEDRVAAYRGNPAPLQQRYQMSQDLLDLLALQKIKSEKDAAVRQMQLAMGQQQAAQGEAPMTVAQQREKEVMEMTKNELAKQRGETAQQQQDQQKEMMQKMMGGIARAPGAAAAAQPVAMAAGGIVAFAEGKSVPGDDKKPLDDAAKREIARAQMQGDRAALMDVLRKLGAAGYDVATLIPRGLAGAIDTALIRPARAITGKEIPYLGSVIDTDSPTPAMDDIRRREAANNQSAAETARLNRPPAPVAPPAAAAPTPPAPPRPAAPPPVAAPPVAATPPNVPATPAAPAAPPASAPGAPAAGLPALVDKTATNLMTQDPAAKQEAMEKRIREMYNLTPDQRRVYEQGTAQRQKMFDEAYNPEKMREDQLIAFLTGAGGRRYGVLGAGAQASAGMERSQREQRLKDFEAMQKGREGLVSLEREGIKPSIEGGLAALREASTGQRSGLEAGYKRVEGELDRNAKKIEGQLDRESREKIAAESNRIQLEIKRAMQEQTSEAARARIMQDINRLEQRGLDGLQKGPIGIAIRNLEQIKSFNPKGFTKEQQKELDDQYKKLAEAEDLVRANMDVYRQQAGKGGSSMSAADKALVDKYTKGK